MKDFITTLQSVVALMAFCVGIISFAMSYNSFKVIKNLSARREVKYEQYPYKVYPAKLKVKHPRWMFPYLKKAFNEGYMAAIYDKKNYETFRGIYDFHSRLYIIFDFFEGEK